MFGCTIIILDARCEMSDARRQMRDARC